MLNGIIATKDRMTQAFVEGQRVPVTVVKSTPHVVTQVKTNDKDGYEAIQVGIGTKKENRVTKPGKGHFKDLNKLDYPTTLKELKSDKELKRGDKINISDVLAVGDRVRVVGVSKGKGFQGGMKRWHFKGGPKTHGQSDRPRSPGSIGPGTDPGRVWKGKKMAGRMGNDRKTIKNLKIVSINEEKGELFVSGPVPGTKGSLLILKKMKSKKKAQE